MAKIRFVREYKIGQVTVYDVVYEKRVNSFYIGEGSSQSLPKTVTNYMEQAKVKIQHDRWHGEEKIYEA